MQGEVISRFIRTISILDEYVLRAASVGPRFSTNGVAIAFSLAAVVSHMS